MTLRPDLQTALAERVLRSRTICAFVNGHLLRLEVASDPESRERGLANRTFLGSNEGMLFVFPKSVYRSFWMKNTSIPLDLAFLDISGRIEEIIRLRPFDATARTSYKPGRFALEVRAGWFRDHDAAVGDVVVLDNPNAV